MGSFDSKRYEDAKNIGVKFFEKNKFVDSNCLGKVVFNSDGFMHLIWKNEEKKHKRDWKNQVKRFQLLHYVKTVLEGMKYYQEFLERNENVKIKERGIPKTVSKKVTYWGFVAVIDNKIRIKIILKKIGEGQIIFWSIIPYWNTIHYKEIRIANLSKGEMACD